MQRRLLEPLPIGAATSKNRIVFGSHETNLGHKRSFSDRHVAYYSARARGGVGMIVTEDASIHSSDWPYERAPLAADCGAGWATVVEACHNEGTLVLAGLGHAGGQGTSHWSQRELWAPGRVPEVNTREVPKLMEAGDIEEVISGFAKSAEIAVEAGCDGVEINAGQFSLVRQFLSGLTNQLDGEYADKPLLARRVISAVRSAIGDEKVLSLRLCCDELAPWAGITPEQAPDVAVGLAVAEGRIDSLTVVRGSIFSAGATRPDGHEPTGFNLETCRTVRAAIGQAVQGASASEINRRVNVVAQGSIVDVDQAEWAITDEIADSVEMTRALIADPNTVSKLSRGAAGEIRPCVLCNQMCMVRDNRNPIVSCIASPAAGHETEDRPVIGDATISLSVEVIGGGPAGLEASRVAALRGHSVRLRERQDHFGGSLLTVAKLPGRQRFALLAEWLEAECVRLGVEMLAGRDVSSEAETVSGDPSSNTIVATGAISSKPQFSVSKAGVVVSAGEVLSAGLPEAPSGSVLVWDPIGGPIAVGIAELLAADGRDVHFATPDYIVGNELARAGDLGPSNARLSSAGVVFHRRCNLTAVKRGSALLADRFSDAVTDLEVDWVVDAGHRTADDALFRAISDSGVRALAAGDCVAPRTVHEAMLEGRRRALDVG